VPAHTPSVVERLAEEGYKVVSGPALDPMPASRRIPLRFCRRGALDGRGDRRGDGGRMGADDPAAGCG